MLYNILAQVVRYALIVLGLTGFSLGFILSLKMGGTGLAMAIFRGTLLAAVAAYFGRKLIMILFKYFMVTFELNDRETR